MEEYLSKKNESKEQNIFLVTPVGSIDEIVKDYGWVYPWLNDKNIKLRKDLPVTNIRFIQIIGTQEEVLEQIKELSLRTAESEYLLGFAKAYPHLLEKYRFIVALDSQKTQGEKGYTGSICIDWHDEPELRLLNESKKIGPSWFIPVHAD